MGRVTIKFRSSIIIIFLLISTPLSAKDFIPNGPLVSRTQNPIYLQFLGQQPSRAKVLETGRFTNWLDFSYSNMFELARNPANEEFLSMELARIGVNTAVGVGDNMQVGIEIPFLHFTGAYFDSWIQAFHKAFGFPNGGRQLYPNGRFNYFINKNGAQVYRVKRQAFGLSDIILSFQHNFVDEGAKRPAIAWKYRFKFPTGSASSGTGSGNIDYSLGVILEKTIKRWHFYLNADYMVIAGNDYLADLQYNEMFAYTATTEFSVTRPVSILVQLQGSTPLLMGLGLNKWNGFPMDLVMGVKGTHEKLIFGYDFFWQWSFSEDIASEGPSVDLTTSLILGIKI